MFEISFKTLCGVCKTLGLEVSNAYRARLPYSLRAATRLTKKMYELEGSTRRPSR